MSAAFEVAPQALVVAGSGPEGLPGGHADREAGEALREESFAWGPEPGEEAPDAVIVDISAGPALPARVAGDLADAHDRAGPGAGGSAGLCDASDAGAFMREVSSVWHAEAGLHAGASLPLGPVARGLTAWVDEARMASQARFDFDFDIDMPVLGLLQGRVSIANGQADLELRACRPSAASLLRSRQSELQRLLERESGGDVNLFIV
jgi:hypothetical protein